MSESDVIGPRLDIAGGEATLWGARSRADGTLVFPPPQGYAADAYEAVPLSREGTLWSYTVQRFRPKSPPYADTADVADFQPFALGYVELDEGLLVEARIKTTDFDALTIGMPMRVTTTSFGVGPDGVALRTFAFEPA